VWWDLAQLIDQVKHTITIFEHTYPDCVVIFIFDQSSAYKGFTENALNINNMNVGIRKKQRKLHNTVILLSNLEPAPSEEDTCSQV
jgi:hypothetical protein